MDQCQSLAAPPFSKWHWTPSVRRLSLADSSTWASSNDLESALHYSLLKSWILDRPGPVYRALRQRPESCTSHINHTEFMSGSDLGKVEQLRWTARKNKSFIISKRASEPRGGETQEVGRKRSVSEHKNNAGAGLILQGARAVITARVGIQMKVTSEAMHGWAVARPWAPASLFWAGENHFHPSWHLGPAVRLLWWAASRRDWFLLKE